MIHLEYEGVLPPPIGSAHHARLRNAVALASDSETPAVCTLLVEEGSIVGELIAIRCADAEKWMFFGVDYLPREIDHVAEALQRIHAALQDHLSRVGERVELGVAN